VSVRIWAYGWREFLFFDTYHKTPDSSWVMMGNRFDAAVVYGTAVVFVVLYPTYYDQHHLPDDGTFSSASVGLHFILTVPLLRLFSLLERVRYLIFTLVRLIPRFTSVFIVLLIVSWVYAIVGVQLMSGKFRRVLQDSAPGGSFDSLREAFLTLFQMLIGESWDELMYAGIDVSHSFAVAFYFMSFIIIVTMLFTNLIVGIVLDAFSETVKRRESDQHEYDAELRRRERIQQVAILNDLANTSRGSSRDDLVGAADASSSYSAPDHARRAPSTAASAGWSAAESARLSAALAVPSSAALPEE
jgi:hypothetical protein